MARTAPAPNIPPIPGMCPGIAVLAGGGGAGGGSGKGSKGGKGKKKGKKGKGKKNASGNKKKGGKGKGDPVCPVTGRVFTDVLDFALPGLIELKWIRSYSSRSTRGGELGIGWSHAYSFRIEVAHRRVIMVDDAGLEQIFEDVPASGEPVFSELGGSLRREGSGYRFFAEDLSSYWFGPEIEGRHYLVAISDSYGNRIAFDRDARGFLRSITDSANRVLRVDCDRDGRITSIAAPTSAAGTSFIELVRYAYDAEGHLVTATDPEGFVFRYVYAGNLLVEHQLPTGLSYFYRYDGAGADAYCVESWGNYRDGIDPALEVQLPQPSPHEGAPPIRGINYVRFTWLKDEHYSEMLDGRGGVTSHFGDEMGRIVKEVDPAGGVTTAAFDEKTGDVIEEIPPNGVARAATIGGDGLPSAVISADGENRTRFMFEGMEWSFDELRRTLTRRMLDEHGVARVVHHPDSTTETYEFDSRGLAVSSTNRSGAITQFVHDAMGNLVEKRTPSGVERYEYDYLGRCIARVDVRGRTEWRWDNRCEIIGVNLPDGRSLLVEYNGLRDTTRILDGAREWQFEYGGIHWLTKITTNAGRTIDIKYNGEGDIVAVRNARGQTLRQKWDQAGRCVECETYEGAVHRAGYDVAAVPTWIESPRGREARVYDSFGSLLSAETDDEAVEVAHDPTARTVTTDNGKVRCEIIYDGNSQPIRDTQGDVDTVINWAGGAFTEIVSSVGTALRHARRPDGKTQTIVVGSLGPIVLDLPAGTGWVSRLGDKLVLRREYDVNGSLIYQALAHVDVSSDLQSAATRNDPQLIVWRSYEWQDLVLRAEHHSDGTTIEHALNADYQVTSRKFWHNRVLEREEAWGYDAGGSPIRPGAQYDAHHRPVRLGNEELEYDHAGFLVVRRTDVGDIAYEWNVAGELVRVVAPDRTVQLTYDARGRRARTQVYRDDQLVRDVRWIWAENVVLHEIDVLTGAVRTFIREDERWNPIAHVDRVGDARTPYFYVNDPVGSLDLVVDGAGTVVWSADRELFGAYRPTKEHVTVSARLPNQHWDEDVGLSYNFYRWFDPRFGLFVSPDPDLLAGSLSPRDYSFNPTVSVDPLGLNLLPPNFGQPGTPTSNLVPGPFAAPATGPVPGYVNATDPAWATPTVGTKGNFNKVQQGFPVNMRRAVDAAGKQHGCHGCPAKTPGNGSKHFVPDHQPPVSQQKAWERVNKKTFPGPVHIYPHCQNCSLKQRNQQSSFRHNELANAAAADAAMKKNATQPAPPVNMDNVNANAKALGVFNGF